MNNCSSFGNNLEDYKRYISNEKCNSFIVIGIMLVILIFLSMWVIICFTGDSEPLYCDNNISIWYYDGDYIELQNDSDEIVNIKIGDNSYNVCDSDNKKVKLGLNSNYGDIKVIINDNDVVHINYKQDSSDD